MATEDREVTQVLGDELLFRSVRDGEQFHVCDPEGRLIALRSSAFNDPARTPSVDRASLRAGGPPASRRNEGDGVVSVAACEVRAIDSVVTNDAKGEVVCAHAVDVRHDPVEANYSHALVEAAPQLNSDSAWKRLKEALCRIAQARGWVCLPQSLRRE